MATRMQQRRGTAAQWISTNSGNGPILAPGEIGFESDNNRFKIGDGVNHWVDLPYFSDNAVLTDLIDGAPDLLNTLGELANALGDDPAFITTVATNLSNHSSDTTNVHGIVDTSLLATKEYVTQEIGNATGDYPELAGEGLAWDAQNQKFAVDTLLIQERVTGVSDTEIGYLSGVTSDIQTQINSKLASADLTEAAQEAVNTALVAGTGLDKSYDDNANTITIDIDSTVATKDFAAELLTNSTKTNITITGDKNGLTITAENGVADSTTSDLAEGTNLYFTDERAQDAVGNSVGTGLTYTDSTGEIKVTPNTYDAYGSASAVAGDLSTHASDTTDVHGIADTSLLATKAYADAAVAAVVDAAPASLNTLKELATALADDANYATTVNNALAAKAPLASPVFSGTVTGITKAMVGLGSVDNTADTAKPVSDATQTALNLKAPIDSPTFTGTIGGITKSMVGLGNVDNTSDANKPVSTATQTALDAKLALAGGTMTGALTLSADPASALHAATKQYVDNTASGVVAKPQVLAATSTNLATTYSNGTAGVGATLTHTSNGAWPTTVAGATGWVIGSGLLVKNQTNKAHNGRYFLSNLGSASTPWVLTRCGFCDEADEIPGAYIFVQGGTLAGTGWIQTVADPATFVVGTDNIDVFQFSGSGTITAGTGITVSGNEVSISTGAITSSLILDGTIVDGDINASAAIAQSKISGLTSDLAAKAPLASPTFTGTVAGITKSMVGLANVDNTSDANKPVSSATQTALDAKLATSTAASTYAPLVSPTFTGTVTLPTGTVTSGMILDGTIVNADISATAAIAQSKIDGLATSLGLKANLASPALTGTPTAPTAAAGTNTTQVATTAFVGTAVADLVASAPSALNTLNELATALGNDASFSTTVTNSLAAKAPLNSPTFTGTVTLPTGTVTSGMILDGTIVAGDIADGAVTSAKILDGTIVDGDINASAAIAQSKIANLTTDLTAKIAKTDISAKGAILVGTGSGTYTAQTVGTNGQVLTANSAQADGVEWTTISGYSAPTLGSTSIASGATVTTIAGLTLTSPIVNTPTLTLSTTTSTTEGVIAWNSTEDKIIVGDGSTAREFASSTLKFNQQAGSYTFVLSDKDKMVESTSIGAVVFTVPTNLSVAFPIGTQIHILQTNFGQITVSPASGVSVVGNPGLKTRGGWSSATLIKRSTDGWALIGDLSA
jgi:hypothetical protein